MPVSVDFFAMRSVSDFERAVEAHGYKSLYESAMLGGRLRDFRRIDCRWKRHLRFVEVRDRHCANMGGGMSRDESIDEIALALGLAYVSVRDILNRKR